MDKELKSKHNSCLLKMMLVDQRYILAQIWHRYSTLFTPLVTFFFTQHHITATVHNIHSDAGSALICSYCALAHTHTHIGIKACVAGTGTIFRSHTSRNCLLRVWALQFYPQEHFHLIHLAAKNHILTSFLLFFFTT